MTAPDLAIVNTAIGMIHPGVKLALWARELHISNGIVGFPARIDRGNWYFRNRYVESFGMGGTRERALVHMVLWAKDERRYGMYAWRHWAIPDVNAVSGDLASYLESNGYADPQKIGCIFCGKTEGRFDWFHAAVIWDKAGRLLRPEEIPDSTFRRRAIDGPGHMHRACATLGRD